MAIAINRPKNGEDLVSVFNSLKYGFGDTYAKEFQQSEKYAKYCATIQKFAERAVKEGWGWFDTDSQSWKDLEIKHKTKAFPTAETKLTEEKQLVNRYSYGWIRWIMLNKLNPKTFV